MTDLIPLGARPQGEIYKICSITDIETSGPMQHQLVRYYEDGRRVSLIVTEGEGVTFEGGESLIDVTTEIFAEFTKMKPERIRDILDALR